MDRALLVGINKYPTAPLNGCVNDIADVAKFLVAKLRFNPDDIRLLTDERATTSGIIDRLGWLLTGLRTGDRILFYYSGHGAQVATRNPQGEVDGLDEVICPVDFDWSDEHMIRDKYFNKLFSPVPSGVEFVWVSDSCHSAGLSKKLLPPQTKEKELIPPVDMQWKIDVAKLKGFEALGLKKAVQSLNVALISGCKSDQTSEDAVFNSRPNGALTYFLLQELNNEYGLTENLSSIVKNVNSALKKRGYEQEPQLEGGEIIQQKAFLESILQSV